MRIKIIRGYLTVIGICAQNESKGEKMMVFTKISKKIISNVSKSDMLLFMGEFNARVGNIPVNRNGGIFGENT
jgi:hypothetical protein